MLEVFAYQFAFAWIRYISGQENGIFVFGTEGLEKCQIVYEFWSDFVKSNFTCDSDFRLHHASFYFVKRNNAETTFEFFQIFFSQRQSCGVGVASEIFQNIFAWFDGFVDIETGHRSCRTRNHVVGFG